MRGEVISLFPDHGYGFIRGEDGVTRFVHAREVVPFGAFDTLKVGVPVEFSAVDHTRGPRAVDVRLL